MLELRGREIDDLRRAHKTPIYTSASPLLLSKLKTLPNISQIIPLFKSDQTSNLC